MRKHTTFQCAVECSTSPRCDNYYHTLASHLPGHFFLPSRLTHLKFKFYLQDWNLFHCVIMIQMVKMLKPCGGVCSSYNLRIDWVPSASC